MADITVLATELRFPEGPVWLRDGSVLVVEIARQALTRIAPDGTTTLVAAVPGGPNGAAVGPDGALYLTNNGGFFEWIEHEGVVIPGPTPATYRGGSVERVDLRTGDLDLLHTHCDGKPLVAPNDLVFDADGGFWFTDHGVQHGEHADQPGLLHVGADGGQVTGAVWGLDSANGVGLSPDGGTVYVAETHPGRLWAFDVVAPGQVADGGAPDRPHSGRLLYDAPEGQLFDSLAVDGEGWVCVATIGPGAITCVSPDGSEVELVMTEDPLTTNVAFGGADGRTAVVTLSSSGRVATVPWPRPGLPLAFTA